MMASEWAAKERSREERKYELREAGEEVHSKAWDDRTAYYDMIKYELIKSGYPWDVAETYLSKLMSYHITGDHLRTMFWMLQGARERLTVPRDADLAVIIDTWPKLPKVIRVGLAAMVKAASSTTD